MGEGKGLQPEAAIKVREPHIIADEALFVYFCTLYSAFYTAA